MVARLVSFVIFVLCLVIRYAHPVLFCGNFLGNYIRRKQQQRTEILLARAESEKKHYEDKKSSATVDGEWEKIDRSSSNSGSEDNVGTDASEWAGVVGFFHPFCNAGGGGERVLWAAIRATQDRWPNALCVVYTGDHDVNKEQILQRVEERFNIHLHPPSVTFLYLSTRDYVLSSTWPHFTLLGQSLGSLVLGWDAFNLLTPDIFIDTMGYAFVVALCKLLFPDVPTGAYVHYPTISTDMLDSLHDEVEKGRGVNGGSGKGWRGWAKQKYWLLFAWSYGWVGGSTDVVMINGSWTADHIRQLWTGSRKRQKRTSPPEIVYPPVAVEELRGSVEITRSGEKSRQKELLYIAQFRPEKDHQLILKSFAELLHPRLPPSTDAADTPRLTLIGSVRDAADEKYIYSLRLLAHELRITEDVTFLLNAPWNESGESTKSGSESILSHLRTASIGVNAMWNEHFGIGVVEYQAAGLISVVHDSGGPKRDIVVEVDEGEGGAGATGFRASDAEGYADAFAKVLYGMNEEERFEMRLRARRNAKRFSEDVFKQKWTAEMQKLINLKTGKSAVY